MKRTLFISVLIFLFYFKGNSQPSKKDIIDHKIKSVVSIDFDNSDIKKKEIKKYYSVLGIDSVHFVENNPAFFFKATFKNNRLEELKKQI